MNRKSTVVLSVSLFAVAAGLNPLPAQTVVPRADEPAIELSPFVVNSSKDTGYQASSTLAGTRLDTPIKDLGAAISIYTKEFLEDIGATNTGDLLIYATSMDAAGPGGNFAGTTSIIGNTVTPDGLRENPQQSSRSRGLSSPTFTRDLYTSLIDIDTYNTDRITVLRGPNAALVGVASPAGVTDTALARADLQRNKHKVSVRFDDNAGLRTIADFNRVLIKDKLAARLIGLQSREEYDQRPAYQLKERVFGALSYKPFKSTMLRGNFESGRMRANQPQMILPINSISNEWYAAGRPGFDWTFYDDPARNPNAAAQNSGNFLPYYISNIGLQGNGGFLVVYNQPTDRVPSTIIQANFPTTAGTIANAIRNGTFHPLLNRDLAADSPRYLQTRNILEFPADSYWIGGIVPPGNLPGFQPPGIKHPSFKDFSAFDFRNRMMDESSLFTQNFHAFNVTLEQSAWRNRVGIALAYDLQRQDRSSRALFFSGNNNNHIRIDPNLIGLDGLPNPNYGRPFVETQSNRSTDVGTVDETVRATTYLKYNFQDLKNLWGKWLGSHTLSGVMERYRRDRISNNHFVQMDGPAVRQLVPAINGRFVSRVVYVGPSLIGNNNPLKLDPIKLPRETSGPLGDILTFTREADAVDPGTYTRSPVSLVPIIGAGSVSREVIKSQAATLQSNWLQDHVATVLGWRRDTDYFAQQATNLAAVGNDPGKTVWGFDDLTFPSTPPKTVSKEVKSWSVVLKWPHKLVKLPAGMDFSVFHNVSENFTPSGSRNTIFQKSLPVPSGETTESGFNFSAFNDKLFLRVNRFETSQVYVSYNGATNVFGSTVNIPVDRYLNWAREGNTNPHLVALRQTHIAKLFSVLPQEYLTLYNAQVSGVAPNISATRNTNIGTATDTTDFTAKGTEFELVYNPTSNWRILANVSTQETINTNTVPGTKAFVALMAPIYQELANVPAGNYPVGWQIGDPLPATTQTLAQFVDLNSLTPLAQELVTEGFPRAEQRKWRYNLVTSYKFGRGSIFGEKLKGWSIGGGFRWQSRYIIGMPGLRNPDGSATFDRAHPYLGPAELNVDAFVGYERKIWSDRIDWKLQLNVTNIYEERALIPINIQPWGDYAAFRLAPERRWYLTNTFSF